MTRQECYRDAEAANRALWDEMAGVHARVYPEVGMLRRGEEILDPIELEELGDVRGKTLLHLQCHIGTDTLAWARRGAVVTGVDFSHEAIARAESLRGELGLQATFVESNVYDLPSVLEGEYDLVYTSRGVLCWLRDLDDWARIVARFLKPGGLFYLMELHPVLYALEERTPGELAFVYPYFHEPHPIVFEAGGPDYADPTHRLAHPSHEWAWPLSDVVNAVVSSGLRLEALREYDRVFHRHCPSMTSEDGRWFRLPGRAGMVPLLFTLKARKPRPCRRVSRAARGR